MSLKLNVGVSKKVGLPDYGSLGASCSLEVDLASTLLNDPESLRVALARVYAICRVAVSKELAVQKAAPGGSLGPQDCREGHPGAAAAQWANGERASTGARPSDASKQGIAPRRATASQIRALHAIAKRQNLDATNVVQSRFGVDRPEDLSITQASELIDSSKGVGNGRAAGGRR